MKMFAFLIVRHKTFLTVESFKDEFCIQKFKSNILLIKVEQNSVGNEH